MPTSKPYPKAVEWLEECCIQFDRSTAFLQGTVQKYIPNKISTWFLWVLHHIEKGERIQNGLSSHCFLSVFV